MENVYITDLKRYNDKRGCLLPFEYQFNCPFDIKRIFLIYNVPKDATRGAHNNILSKHMLIAIKGSCTVKCIDNEKEIIYDLNSPDKGLFINNNIYKEIYNFSNDAVLLCLTNTKYNSEEYVSK